jgi:hypothetical protein
MQHTEQRADDSYVPGKLTGQLAPSTFRRPWDTGLRRGYRRTTYCPNFCDFLD